LITVTDKPRLCPLETSWDLGCFAAMLALGHTFSPTTKYEGSWLEIVRWKGMRMVQREGERQELMGQ